MSRYHQFSPDTPDVIEPKAHFERESAKKNSYLLINIKPINRRPKLIPLIGYTDRLSARPGDTVEFKVSSDSEHPFSADLIRVICADPNPEGPGLIEHDVPIDFGGAFPSRVQPFHPGSYGRIKVKDKSIHLSTFTLTAIIWPTSPGIGRQNILSLCSANGHIQIELTINEQGYVEGILTEGTHQCHVTNQELLKTRHWYRIWLIHDAHSSQLTIGSSEWKSTLGFGLSDSVSKDMDWQMSGIKPHSITFAADSQTRPQNHFNGKLESPIIFEEELDEDQLLKPITALKTKPVFHWDFSQGISTSRIQDQGPHGCHGKLVNSPTRAMTGVSWDGSEMAWRHAPHQYGAIHFHDDDIYDFEWETDFRFIIPPDLPSGTYAARIRCGDQVDKIPFFVCPGINQPKAKLCVLVSTFTYTVYGNHARPDFDLTWIDRIKQWNAYPWYPAVNQEYGLSTYNNHHDGSGICHASAKRPLMNIRPGYITFGASEDGCSGLRHFQADSHLITWLESKGIEYDIVTDQELHDSGVDALKSYAAVTTGTHPEYHTRQTLDAIEQYQSSGGNFMYLGGNGFYWKISLHDEDPSLLEIRRGEGGIRAWAAEPGEYYQAFDGSYGGLWRRNGYPPQKIAGIGFSAQGTFKGSYYRRSKIPAWQKGSNDPMKPLKKTDTDWIFSGINDDILGDFGLSGGGAAGFELDRVDYRLGSNEDIQILASSEGHDDSFVLVPEEQLTHITNWPGEPVEKLLRADMIYQKLESGGLLFATGSITFCGSLLHNDGDNNISKLLYNVVEKFTQ